MCKLGRICCAFTAAAIIDRVRAGPPSLLGLFAAPLRPFAVKSRLRTLTASCPPAAGLRAICGWRELAAIGPLRLPSETHPSCTAQARERAPLRVSGELPGLPRPWSLLCGRLRSYLLSNAVLRNQMHAAMQSRGVITCWARQSTRLTTPSVQAHGRFCVAQSRGLRFLPLGCTSCAQAKPDMGSLIACEAQPVFVAARLVVAERLLMPLAFVLPLWVIFLLLLALLLVEQFLRVGLLVITKWLLIGRYTEGEHDIYSLMYLRHWLVEHLAKGTIVGQNAHQGSSIAFLFMRNLALKALGADLSLSSVITARVVAFDLVSVGDLATVHGPRHLTAVNYGSRRMVLKRVKVGAGAYVGPNCTLEPGCEVALLKLPGVSMLLARAPSLSKTLSLVLGGRRRLCGAFVHCELRHRCQWPCLRRAGSAGSRPRPRSAAHAGRGPPLPQSRGCLHYRLLASSTSESTRAHAWHLRPAAVARHAAEAWVQHNKFMLFALGRYFQG